MPKALTCIVMEFGANERDERHADLTPGRAPRLYPALLHAGSHLHIRVCHKGFLIGPFSSLQHRLRVFPQQITLTRDPHCIRARGAYFLGQGKARWRPIPDTPAARPDKPNLRQQLANPRRFVAWGSFFRAWSCAWPWRVPQRHETKSRRPKREGLSPKTQSVDDSVRRLSPSPDRQEG